MSDYTYPVNLPASISAGTAFAVTSTQQRHEILYDAARTLDLPQVSPRSADRLAREMFLRSVPRDSRPTARRLLAKIPTGQAAHVLEELATAERSTPTVRAWALAFALYRFRRSLSVTLTASDLTTSTPITARRVRARLARRPRAATRETETSGCPIRRPRAHAPPRAADPTTDTLGGVSMRR